MVSLSYTAAFFIGVCVVLFCVAVSMLAFSWLSVSGKCADKSGEQ